MSKRVEIDGKYYRNRRGKLVEIPIAWVNEVTYSQTQRKRPSKHLHKHRKAMRGCDWKRSMAQRTQDRKVGE